MSRFMPILAIRSSTKSLQSTGKRVFHDGTDRHTDDSKTLPLIDWIGINRFSWKRRFQFSNNNNTLFDQKTTALSLFWSLTERTQTIFITTDIAVSKLNCPIGQSSENHWISWIVLFFKILNIFHTFFRHNWFPTSSVNWILQPWLNSPISRLLLVSLSAYVWEAYMVNTYMLNTHERQRQEVTLGSQDIVEDGSPAAAAGPGSLPGSLPGSDCCSSLDWPETGATWCRITRMEILYGNGL